MKNQLEQNLPTLHRKIIHFKKRGCLLKAKPSSPPLSLSSLSTCKAEEEESHSRYKLCQVEVKPLRCRLSRKYYVTRDGITFPVTPEQSYAPLNLINLSNKVKKILVDKATRDITYCLSPTYDSSEVIPWEDLLSKLKCEGYSDHCDLLIAFENLMLARQEWVSKLEEHPESLGQNVLDRLEVYQLSESVPQIAEIRESRGERGKTPDFPISKITMNKPMQRLLGISNEDDAIASLHIGIKSLRFFDRSSSMKFLQKYFEHLTRNFQEDFTSGHKDVFVAQTTCFTADGTAQEMKIFAKLMKQGRRAVWVYSFKILDRKENNVPLGRDSEQSDVAIKEEALSNKENTLLLARRKQEILDFLQIFNYPSKFYDEEPPQHLVCRIRWLNSSKPSW